MSHEFVPLTREVFSTLRADDLVFYRSPGRMGYTDLYQICMRDGRLFQVCDGFDAPQTEVATEDFLNWIEPLTLKMVKFRLFQGFGMAIFVRQSRLRMPSFREHLLSRLRPEYFVMSYDGSPRSYDALVEAVTEELKTAGSS